MINLLCYEPPGQVLRLSADDLTRHVLGLGATGCGKTTGLINPVLEQAIACRAGESESKTGLLVLDPKSDDTASKVQAYAQAAGRQSDVVILSDSGDAYYDYFAGLHKLSHVDEFARRALYGSQAMGADNAYWTESRLGLVTSALTVLLASGEPLRFDTVAEFLTAWFFDKDSENVKARLQFVERILRLGELQPATRRRLQLALAEAQNWRDLEPRTRELHKSTISNALRVLLSPEARNLFDESRRQRFDSADVLKGKILVATVNAVSHSQLAALLFKNLKRDFYTAVLSRVLANPDRDRLCGLVLDELQLSIVPDDVPALALLRSKGGFVVACAQGLCGLDEALGRRQRACLLNNFNSVFYFTSREDETDEHAMIHLGLQDKPKDADAGADVGNLQVLEGARSQPIRWVCAPGSLARLPQHHVYARLASGAVTKRPVWLEAKFHEFVPPPVRQEADDLAAAVSSLRSADEDAAKANADVPLLLLHMHRRRHPLRLTPDVVAAAWQLCRPKLRRNRWLARMDSRIEGLEELPSCWLAGVAQWVRKNPSLAAGIVCVGARSGVLWVELDGAFGLWGDGPLVVPESLNLFVYPSLWRPLLPRHLAQLLVERPDLRPELRSLPQAMNPGV
jgi:hypothetical protein